MPAWSEKIARHYQLRVPADLAAWLDGDLWQQAGGAEFHELLSPEQLLNPDMIWAGFMQPDTLPIIGNQYGDWLCLRIGREGVIREVIYWCHGGGDWLPYGQTLAEALLYDAAFRVLYERRHEFVGETPATGDDIYQLAEWATDWIEQSEKLVRFWRVDEPRPLEALLQCDVAEVAARRDLILRHLETQLKSSDRKVADEIGASWEPDFVSWMFDAKLVPERQKDNLSRRFNMPVADLTQQNWDAAEAEALKILALRDDLGWAFDIAGWAAERRGDFEAAIARYLGGLQTSLFADDSVRFRTHWFADGYGKFSAARLAELQSHLPAEVRESDYLQLFWQNDPESLRARLRDHWMQEARQASSRGDHWAAYRAYYNAGWDFGLQFVKSYAEILDGLVESATAAGSPALATMARTHRELLLV